MPGMICCCCEQGIRFAPALGPTGEALIRKLQTQSGHWIADAILHLKM